MELGQAPNSWTRCISLPPVADFFGIKEVRRVNVLQGDIVRPRFDALNAPLFRILVSFVIEFAPHNQYLITSFMIRRRERESRTRYSISTQSSSGVIHSKRIQLTSKETQRVLVAIPKGHLAATPGHVLSSGGET